MEEIFRKIQDNFYESQQNEENLKNLKSNDSEDTTEDSSKIGKIKIFPKTEKKNSNFFLENKEEGEEEEKNNIDEYADYGRIDKTGIHFQIISDYNVSMEIVPDELVRKDVKDLIIKYKGVFDETMNLWIIPYINYELLYKELYQIEGINTKLHRVGAIAKQCYENKELTTLTFKRKEKQETIDYLNDNKLKRSVDELPKKLKNALYDFQVEGIKFGIEHHCRFLLADEMGVGKTIQAIALAYLYRDSWPVLIVCPGSMKYLWKGEIQTWLGFKDKRINILNSSKQKISQEAYFYIISYDLVSHILKKLKKMTFNFVILDEAHSIKNRISLRAKTILPIAIRAQRLILMTGTPLLAKPLEGYPLLYALRPDLFQYFKKYAYRYCDPQPTPFGVNWSGTSNTKELHWLLSTLMVRRLKKDVLNRLPPKRRQKVTIETNPEIIQEIKTARTKVKGRTGTLEAYTLTATAKKEGVCEYISDLLETEEKFIVFAYHHEMLNRIESLIKEKNIDYIRIDGSTKQDKRYEYVTHFQKKKSCQVAILSIVAASTGITLNSAHIVVFAELTWTPSIMIQAEDRAHRIGQKGEFVDIKYLYGPETLDDFILDKLQKKIVIVSTTIDDKKENFGVKANPLLIHPTGKSSKELIEMAKGELNLSDSNEEEDDEDTETNIEKKLLKDLNFGIDNINEEENKGINNKNKRKKKNKKQKINKENKENIENIDNIDNIGFIYPKKKEFNSDDLDNINIIDIDTNKIIENKNGENKENLNKSNNYFININNNIKENESNNIIYPKSDIKLKPNNDFYINLDNFKYIENSNYKKDNHKTYLNNDNIFKQNNINFNTNKKKSNIYKYPKEEEIETNNDDFSIPKDTKEIKNKKNQYLKRDKTLTPSNGKREKRISIIKELRKAWASDNRAKSSDKKNKRKNKKSNQKQKNNENKENENVQENIENNFINNNKNTNNDSYYEKPNNKEIFKNYENNLFINLHKANMRRNISQEETKPKSINFDDESIEKFSTQQKKLFFPSNNFFKESNNYKINDKDTLI